MRRIIGRPGYSLPAIVLALLASGFAHAGEVARAFEADLNDSSGNPKFRNSPFKRFDTNRYKNFVLKWEGKIGDTGCVVYHAREGGDPRNFAIKLVKRNGLWVVNGYNVMPGSDVSAYDSWLKFNGCKK